MADVGLSPEFLATAASHRSNGPCGPEYLRRALTERVGPLGWVLEGVLHSIVAADLEAAMRLWGEEVLDLLWERKLLVSPDGDREHQLVRLSDDAFAWAMAMREDRSPYLGSRFRPEPLPVPAESLRVADDRGSAGQPIASSSALTRQQVLIAAS